MLTHCRTRVTVQFLVGEKRNLEILLEQKPVPSFLISVEQHAENFFPVVVETQQYSLFVLCNYCGPKTPLEHFLPPAPEPKSFPFLLRQQAEKALWSSKIQ
jgi:hypothetical protein